MGQPFAVPRRHWAVLPMSLIAVSLIAALGQALAPARAAEKVVMQEFMVPASDPGIQLYVRNKHPAGVQAFSADRVLVYVHGATYPAETAFDLPVGGASMMDMLAARGWDVWMLDVRGYSRSTRPAEMDRPAADAKPLVESYAGIWVTP